MHFHHHLLTRFPICSPFLLDSLFVTNLFMFGFGFLQPNFPFFASFVSFRNKVFFCTSSPSQVCYRKPTIGIYLLGIHHSDVCRDRYLLSFVCCFRACLVWACLPLRRLLIDFIYFCSLQASDMVIPMDYIHLCSTQAGLMPHICNTHFPNTSAIRRTIHSLPKVNFIENIYWNIPTISQIGFKERTNEPIQY